MTLALAKRPRLLVLDEPVANLDPLARRDFLRALMDAVAADGLTVLLSSHVIAELERVCDHLILLRDGRIRLVGLCQVGARGRPLRRSHRGAGRLHTGQAPAQQASRTCSWSSSCHRVRPTPPVLGVAAVPG